MFSSKILCVLQFSKIINYETRRSIRGAVTVPLKIVKSSIPGEKKSKYTEKESKRIRKSNPGIGHSLRGAMEEYDVDFEQYLDDENLHDSEMGLEDIKPQLQSFQEKYEKEEIKKSFFNIKRKHFKSEKLPNMLTYAEKFQIKHLHKQDPYTWNADKLAECFPATPVIIKKILKSKFVAYTVEAIVNHDKTVRKNWELFKNGNLPVDKELQEIYSSFVNRSNIKTNPEEMKKFLPSPPDFASQITKKEFSNIIISSKKYRMEEENRKKNVEFDDQGRTVYSAQPEILRFIDENRDSRSDKVNYTLDTFRKKISTDLPTTSKEVDAIIVAGEPPEQLTSSENLPSEKFHTYNNLHNVGVVNKDFNPFLFDKNSSKYPLRINIPAKLKNKNKLYKVRDCFYDDNGFFLYRVPGLVD